MILAVILGELPLVSLVVLGELPLVASLVMPVVALGVLPPAMPLVVVVVLGKVIPELSTLEEMAGNSEATRSGGDVWSKRYKEP